MCNHAISLQTSRNVPIAEDTTLTVLFTWLSKALFPIGHLLKSEVRKIAKEQKLASAEKKDSQGLCFIGKVRLPEFLQQQLKTTPSFNPAAKYSQVTAQQQANADALKNGQPLPK